MFRTSASQYEFPNMLDVESVFEAPAAEKSQLLQTG